MIPTKQKSRSVLQYRTAVRERRLTQSFYQYYTKLQSRLSSMRFEPDICAGCGREFKRGDYILENMIAGERFYTCDDVDCVEAVIRDVLDIDLSGADMDNIVMDVVVGDGRADELLELEVEESLEDIENYAWKQKEEYR